MQNFYWFLKIYMNEIDGPKNILYEKNLRNFYSLQNILRHLIDCATMKHFEKLTQNKIYNHNL